MKEKDILTEIKKISLWPRCWEDTNYINWKLQCLPHDMTGKSVLDVGAAEGFYSFISEHRGAKRILTVEEYTPTKATFEKMKQKLNSKCEHKTISIYDLDEIDETFDIVLFLDVYYHLENPLLALRKIYPKVKESLIFCGYVLGKRFADVQDDQPLFYLFESDEFVNDKTNVLAGTKSGIKRMLKRTGFSRTKEHKGMWDERIIFEAKPDHTVNQSKRVSSKKQKYSL